MLTLPFKGNRNTHKLQFISLLRFFSMGQDCPSSLSDPPTLALVKPGNCQFTNSFTQVSLLKRWKISPTSSVLRFNLPDESAPLNLSTCACILAKANLSNEVIRPYTPISTNLQIGSFDLLIKDYGSGMSNYLCSTLEEGSKVEFKHIDFNVKIQAPFQYKTISMLVGGTGITPMFQALHAILGDPKSDTKAVMLYGSRVSSDILGKEILDSWEEKSDRLKVVHVLSDEPDDSNYVGEKGYISKDLIEKNFPPPQDKSNIIFICGPPAMYDALTGPRAEKDLSGLLKEMGYSADQVYKF